MFYYNNFIINTYPDEDDDYILSISLSDDSVKTKEGIYLGMTFDDMINAYGEDYKNELGLYTYTLGDTEIAFLIENDTIISITYYFLIL